MIRRIHVEQVDSTGIAIEGGRRLKLHGYALSEVNATAGILLFQTAAANKQSNFDGPAAAGSPTAFQRGFVASADLPFVLDHEGVDYPGGLALQVKTGTAKVSGDIFVS